MTPTIYLCGLALTLFGLIFARGAEWHKENDPPFYIVIPLGWFIMVPALAALALGYLVFSLGKKFKGEAK